ncbi:DUF3846 domain-containing protein [Rhodococcus erythropolis]|uniref:DUF3846 domain-containing protein n=1 Tax=Rhodococcus erythropolis TaxID=1833 RepID=UPI0024B93BB2|nr:DUF3846 domain-containing protein [Rhodococcus erythropolis]MDJ0403949.1 DUF3846 domain-containing protein [Rhodococcus erythropolis]
MNDSMQCRAVKVLVDGSATIVDLGDDTLAALRTEIGCQWVDVIRFPGSLDCWIDDEGAVLADARVNFVVTVLARSVGMNWQQYYGTGLFANHDADGNTVGLSEVEADGLVLAARAICERVAAQQPSS